MGIQTTAFRYPVFGPNREYKRAIEGYWKDKHSKQDMLEKLDEVNLEHRLKVLNDANLDQVPSSDFFPYDFVLDTAVMFGIIPDRFDWDGGDVDIDTYYAMARGSKDAVACEMTKWFDTNYHYMVPEITGEFTITENKPLQSYKFAKEQLGIETKPVMVGPFTFLCLSKVYEDSSQGFEHGVKATQSDEFQPLLNRLAELYNEVLKELQDEGVQTVQIDEPSLVLDRTNEEVQALLEAYGKLTEGLDDLDIHVQTYYESLSHYKDIAFQLPVEGIGLDMRVNDENFNNIKKHGFPSDKQLIAGLIGGRDVWATNFDKVRGQIQELTNHVTEDKIIVSNSCPLFHLPVSVEPDKQNLNDQLLPFLAFANERLEELEKIKNIINNDEELEDYEFPNLAETFKNEDVQQKVQEIDESDVGRTTPFEERYPKQIDNLDLPLFPTTTIGSFPQTREIRKKRARHKASKISTEEYNNFIREQIQNVIDLQEDIGLDMFVHGEFERSDMVEFFGQRMDGFAFTKKGWVQSYGTRGVRPPIIYGDVSRPEPMTTDEIKYAQSLTDKPVKGMLTGPVTILNWSFARNDIPRKQIAYQIAIALRDEVLDLEQEGVKAVQIDEPAFREGLPLKEQKQADYLDWAVNAFKLTHDRVQDETMIQTHMCYSEFNEIIESIHNMDADVLFVEASRSKGELLEVFEKFNYSKGIGPGVYDIHSPRVPTKEEINIILDRATAVIDNELIWINPDCGLKTRKYEETVPSLKNMVECAKALRDKVAVKQ